MADTDFFKPEQKRPALEAQFEVNGKLVISYFGAMGFANGLEYLLGCAAACQQQDLAVQFLLVGDGAERENLQVKAQSMQLKNLSLHSFQTRDGILELMNVTDVVFVSYRHAPILETGSPNKFFDGLAAGKLIFINFGGWIREEIEEAQCGFYLDPEKPESIVPILNSLLASGQLSQYQVRSRQLAEQKFSRNKLTEQWVSIFDRY
jgi:glycosyltransferase involved in cell wall biosynthesis